MKVKIRKGDTVEVISGRRADKGKRGEVIKVYRSQGRVAVQGINIRKKHQGQIQAQGLVGNVDVDRIS
ncbi:MAG: KOW motif-containing protein, partial [Anaerolineales bacterium]